MKRYDVVSLGFGLLVLGLVASEVKAQEKSLRWPTVASVTRINYGFDNNAEVTAVSDWTCGTRAYDGHRGHDLGTPRNTDVFAAAKGWVQRRADGFGDGYTGSTDGNGFGNHVALYHEPGNFNTIYGHMTSGTGIPNQGDTVQCGARIGGSGTSGNSSGPHLHFEIRLNVNRNNYYSGKEVDPFTGPCSTPVSYWRNQGNDRPAALCEDPVSVRGGSERRFSPWSLQERLERGFDILGRMGEGSIDRESLKR